MGSDWPCGHAVLAEHNLALCDDYLGHVRKELEDNGTWDSTTLVLMGDNSWRTSGPAGRRVDADHCIKSPLEISCRCTTG